VATAASRRDLLAAKDLLHAGALETKVRSAAWLPKLAVVGRYDLYGTRLFGSTGTNGSLMAVATINVFQGGADRAALAAARADLRAGQEDVARFEEGVALEVRQSFEEAATSRARHATALKALDSARETERITNERFRSGVVKTLDVLDAATARREAETRELVSRAEAQAAVLKLAVKGGRTPESALPDAR
jgi:outer membrane protein TolC